MEDLPTPFMDTIRPTVRAVIHRGSSLLVQIKQKPGKPVYLTLPGGKQEPGETAVDALKRECMEEVGAHVTVGSLLHVAEVFRQKETRRQHQLELLFACQIADDYIPILGPHPDPSQIGTIWASPFERAAEFRPGYGLLLSKDSPLYLGVLDG